MLSRDFIRGMGSISLFPQREEIVLEPLSSFIDSDVNSAFQKDLATIGADMWAVIDKVQNEP